MSVAGPSHFVNIKSLTVTALTTIGGSSSSAAFTVYSVPSVTINRNIGTTFGGDNNKTRAVSAHATTITDTISFPTQDINALKSLDALKGTFVQVAFVWGASANQLTTSPLADQTVTIHNVYVGTVDIDPVEKGLGSGRFNGTICQMSDNSEPIVYS